MVVLTPEGYDNLHTGDSHRSPICHTGDSHRSRFVTPEPSHRRRVDHTGPICSCTHRDFNSAKFCPAGFRCDARWPGSRDSEKSRFEATFGKQHAGKGPRSRRERREKRKKREERREGPHLKTVARPTSNYLSGLETAGLLLVSPCLNRLALEACASLAKSNACSGVLGRLGANPARRQASVTPAPRLRSWLAS